MKPLIVVAAIIGISWWIDFEQIKMVLLGQAVILCVLLAIYRRMDRIFGRKK